MSKPREALEKEIIAHVGLSAAPHVMERFDTYAKAERLEEHGRTCTMASPAYREDGVPINIADSSIDQQWYCYCDRGKELNK